MQLVATDLLTDACGLSRGLAILTVLVGLVWWLFGWWSHRFWVVLLATVLAGIYALSQAPALHTPPLLTAVLLSIASGVLALALVRVVGFVAAGVALLIVTQEVWPSLDQPIVTFLIGGLACLTVFRLCLMALTSFGGAVLLCYGVLMLLHASEVVDAPVWADRSTGFLNFVCILLSLFGLVFQFFFERYQELRKKDGGAKSWWAWLPAWRWPWWSPGAA